MDRFYRIYELSVASSRRLPYLCQTSAVPIDVDITFVENRLERSPSNGSFYFWELSEGGLGFWTRLTTGYAEYTISADGNMIRIIHSEGAPFQEVLRYVTGVSLGAVLRFRGILCLHASAVVVNGAALVFAGPSHAGKSTLSAAFHRRGHPLISEDVVAIDARENHVRVRPGYPGVRLYPDTLNHLYGSVATAKALPVDHKLLHRLDTIPNTACPVRALYLLAPRNPEHCQPRVTRIDKTSALLALTGQLYLHRFAGKRWLGRDFPQLGKLVEVVPVYLLERSDTLFDLDATIDLVLEQQATIEMDSADSGKLVTE